MYPSFMKWRFQTAVVSALLLLCMNSSAYGAKSDSRFGLHRPSNITGIKPSVDPAHTLLTIKWHPSRSNEGVDEYAIHVRTSPCADPCRGVLWQLTKSTESKIHLIPSYKATASTPSNYWQLDPGETSKIWIIAHNKYGWGNNDQNTLNPDETMAEFKSIMAIGPQSYPFLYPTEVDSGL